MLSRFRADLHVHTCLSPCGDLDMSPRHVAAVALERKLDVIAVCDHNSAENAAAVRQAAASAGRLTVLCGLEICTSEEVHLLALFDTPELAGQMQDLVYDRLPPGVNRPEFFGEQVVANATDEVEGFCHRLLIGAAEITLNEAVNAVHRLGGLAVASHVDREAFGLFGHLGLWPQGLDLDAAEVSARCRLEEFLTQHPDLAGRPVVRSSDAHFLEDLGRAWTEFRLYRPLVSEIGLALGGRRGRRILGLSAPVA